MISIIIPSWNYAEYLPITLESILAQTYEEWEAIIVDDGSTDNSWDIANDFARLDNRFQCVKHKDAQNHGLKQTLALGFQLAKYPWLAVLEADDFWEKTCLEARLQRVNQDQAKLVFSNVNFQALATTNLLWHQANWQYLLAKYASKEQSLNLTKAFYLRNLIPTFSSVMFHKELLSNISWQAPVERWLDWWFWLQMSLLTPFAYIATPLVNWRIHKNSWNFKVSFSQYLADYQRMGYGIKQIFLPDCLAKKQYLRASLLIMPAILRLCLRLSQDCLAIGPRPILRRILYK